MVEWSNHTAVRSMFLPTVLHLLRKRLDYARDYLQIGSDLLSPFRQQIVPFRNGDFISPDITRVGEKNYSNATGQLIEGIEYKDLDEQAKMKLKISDEIVYKDLLRFYTPEGFTPINRKDYQYVKKVNLLEEQTVLNK